MTEYKVQIPFRGTLTKRKLLRLLDDMPDDTPVRIMTKVTSANRGVEVAKQGDDEDVYLSLAPTAEYISNLGCTLTAYCPD
jgi:hypothetical protein